MEFDVDRDILLAKSLEQADAQAVLIPLAQREQFTREAKELARTRAGTGLPETHFLGLRARLLLNAVEAEHPVVRHYRRPNRALVWLLYLLPLLGFLFGLLTERISNPHRIDLLAFPLLAVLAWNLAVYVALAVSRFVRPLPSQGLIRRAFPGLRLPGRTTAVLPEPLLRGLQSFSHDWSAAHGSRWKGRWSSALHWSAAALAAGMIVSLYGRGLIVAYHVGWESTFLSASQVTAVLNLLFWPVSALSGLAPLTVPEVASLEFGAAPVTAQGAAWVHRYAGLLALIVVLPRSILGLLSWALNRRSASRPDYQSPYFQRLLGELSDRVLDVRLLPYSLALDRAHLPAIQAALRTQLSASATFSFVAATPYGEAPPLSLLTQAEQALLVVVFAAASTPEPETQGAFLQELLAHFPNRVLVLLDQHRLEQKWAAFPDGAQRLQQRQTLWRQFLAHYGVNGHFASLSSDETSS